MWSIFLLPSFLYLGVAGQAFGLYLCAIAVPWYAFSQRLNIRNVSLCWTLGTWMLIAWLVFPTSNLLNVWWPLWDPALGTGTASELPLRKLLSSQLSSTWLVSAVFFLLIAINHRRDNKYGFNRNSDERSDSAFTSRKLFGFFSAGFAIASLIFGFYYLLQHLTGFDYRLEEYILPPNRLMSDGRYRVSGLFSHPLSVAGTALTLFSYFITLTLCGPRLEKFAFGSYRPVNYKVITAWIASCNFGMLVMSGGRTAIACSVLVLVLASLCSNSSWFFTRTKLLGAALGLAASGFFAVWSGITQRYLEFFAMFDSGKWMQWERLTFWKIHVKMIADNPVYGHGAAHLRSFLREGYYDFHGLESMPAKYNAHNIYLEVLANVGLVGAFVIGLAMMFCLRTLYRMSRSDPLNRSLFMAALAALGANAMHGFTQNVFFDASVLAAYLALLWFHFWMIAARP